MKQQCGQGQAGQLCLEGGLGFKALDFGAASALSKDINPRCDWEATEQCIAPDPGGSSSWQQRRIIRNYWFGNGGGEVAAGPLLSVTVTC